jgi:iron uptake system component EfeO
VTPSPVRVVLAGLVALGPLALAACGSDDPPPPASGSGAIAVEAKDDACTVARTSADAGTVTFEVTNKGSKVTEFYFYADGDRVLGEVENIKPGDTRRLITEVAEGGKYTTACKPGMKGDGIRNAFTVNGQAAKRADNDAKLAEATKNYQRYVNSQADALLAKTTEFVDAVKAKKVDEAKALFPVARTYWERIEPVAESFGDLDPKIDGREDSLDEGMAFTGYHRLEKDLWQDGLKDDSATVADQLLTDVKEIVTKAKAVELTPVELANGAKELLDEVATGKITGEEDRYSHTDLWDFKANVEGSQAAVAALRPVVQDKDSALASTLDEKFKAVNDALEKQRKGDGFKLFTELTEADTKALAEAVDALGEPVSKVAEVVTK